MTTELRSAAYRDAVVNPTARVASDTKWFRERLFMGVYDESGELVPGSVLDRRAGERGAAVPPGLFPEPVDADVTEAIYAGPLYFHFGHFLLESLARAWYLVEHPDLPVVWAGAHSWETKSFEPWQLEILDILGITNQPRFVHQPTRFGKLHVPDIGYRYDDWIHPRHAAFLARYQGPHQERDYKLWLSRGALASGVHDRNAVATERRLAAAGWHIVQPERLTVREQLDRLARATLVAGEEGSAFHSLLLLKDVGQKRFVLFRRRGSEHPNLHTIGEARGVDQQFFTLGDEAVLSAKGRAVSKMSANASGVLDALAVPVARTDIPPPNAAELRALAQQRDFTGAASLLDVNQADGAVFRALDVVEKAAVCPCFSFDPREFAALPGTYYEMDLTGYLAGWGEGRTYDLIRISGTPTQLVKDFETSRPLGHAGTTWVLNAGDAAPRIVDALTTFHPGYEVRRQSAGQVIITARAGFPGDAVALVATDAPVRLETPAAVAPRRHTSAKEVVSVAIRTRLGRLARRLLAAKQQAAKPLTPAQERRRQLRAMNLTELGREFGTDKATKHHYTQHYERHLAHLRDTEFNLLEIGIGGYKRDREGGASLRMWKHFFPKAQIIGLDIEDKSFVDRRRIKSYRGSQVDQALLERIVKEDGPLQVIIDDGSHRPEHIRETFRILFPLLVADGIYVIEDTQTSYWPSMGGSVDRSDANTTMALVKDLLDGLNHEEFADPDYEPTYTDQHVVAVHAYHNLVFIQKGLNNEGSNMPMHKRL